MANVKVVLSPDPIFLQGSGTDPTAYDAASDRKFMQDAMGEGVRDMPAHFSASVVSGMTARFAPGVAYIRGKNTTDQGSYRQFRSVDTDISAPASHGSLPRLDQIILRVLDYTHDNNDDQLFEGRLEWIEGTATSGATLDNRLGAADLTTLPEDSKSCILIWDYLMPAGASSLSFTNFRDKRVRAVLGQGLSTITPTGITNADISSSAAIGISKLAGYPSDSGKFLRGDGTWATLVIPSPKYAKVRGVTTGNGIPNFSNVYLDNDGMYNAGAPSRLTIQTAGVYIILLQMGDVGGASWIDGNILVNGGAVGGFGYGASVMIKGGATWFGALGVGNYVQMQMNGWQPGDGSYRNVQGDLSVIQVV
jgi:hypothetical protein